MVVTEKDNLWLQKYQKNAKYSHKNYLAIKSTNEIPKAKLKTSLYSNYLENKSKTLLPPKSTRHRKCELANRSKYLSIFKQVEIEATFTALVKQWREENRGVSSTNQMSMHPAYQQIIGMGEVAIPLLLRELEKKSGQWFWALKSITREDPVPPECKGNTKEMTKAWLEWGRRKGYKW
ncbi:MULTISPECIES: hypothetical protein [Fischerella]|uniref:hypothetical protein n=1 Tax=Fischerella TaxID=1190 RepID=UPI0002D42A50|nr:MULTISPECIES: hypothetical protein [Fischerella]